MDYKKDIIVYDLETPEQCFLASFYIRETGEWRDFLINAYQNDLYLLLKFLDENKNKWFCGYNVLKFDGQVIEFILKNYSSWIDKSNLEISYMISQFASEEIDKGNYSIHSTYKEYEFTYNQLDLPSIWHFFNENRRVSLKQLEFEMRAENIENLEFELDQTFSEEQVQDMIVYCHNDVTCTNQFLEYTIGNTDNELYKGKDKIKDREIIMKEVGLPCMNYDDVKIGAEWNKKDYMMLTGKRDFELKPQKVNYFYGKKYRDFFPKTVTFQTENVKSFIKKLGQTTILNVKQEFIVDLDKNLQGCIAKGGIHSREKERFIKPLEDSVYIQNDIGLMWLN